MNYTIAIPSSSIQKTLNYGIISIASVSGGVSVANGTTTVTSLYPDLPPVTDPAYEQANVATVIAGESYNQANTATDLAYTVWAFANTIGGGSAIDNVARQIAISAQANTIIIQGVNLTQNSWIQSNNSIQASINETQNTRLDSIETVNNNQNTAILNIQTINNQQNTTISIIQDVNNTQNTWISTNNSIQAGVNATQNTRLNSIETINSNQNTAIGLAYDRANTSVNTIAGTSGTITTSNGRIVFQSTNGVTVTGSDTSLTINTPQALRITDSPTFNGLTLTNPLAIGQGGTGSTSASAALTALLPAGAVTGYVLTTGGPGTYYWAAGGGGGGGATPGTTISSQRLSYIANGAGFSYTTPTYIPGASQLRVYFDGVRQFASTYTETSSTIVTFLTSPASGINILIEVDGYINNPYYANNISFTSPFGSIPADANTIQLAMQDLESRKATLASPSFTGIATAVTPPISTSNTQIATTGFVHTLANSGITFSHNITGSATSATTATSALTAATATTLDINNNYQISSLGVGTAASGVSGEIRATNNITAYYSDDRLKKRLGVIQDALEKVNSLTGFYYQANETAQSLGYKPKKEVGLSAQEVQKILPEIVVPAPIDEQYLTIYYEKLIPLLVEAIKELTEKVEKLERNKE